MSNLALKSAIFDKNVKKYWLLFWLLLLSFTFFFIPLIPLILIFVWLISQRQLNAMSAELFERKLVVKRGIWFRVEKSIPLEKITDVGLTQGPLMRLFKLYRLDFETAGQTSQGALVSMLGIVDAMEFRESILFQKDALQKNGPQALTSSSELNAEKSDIRDLVASVKRIEIMLEKVMQKNNIIKSD
jgi:putative membrane protein